MPNLSMESETVIPAKKQRTISITNPSSTLKVSECIREFKLPQAYPSMAKYQKLKNGRITVGKISLPFPISSPIIRQSDGLSRDMKSSNTLQKLTLKSPDGRSLGEFDVHILPRVQDDTVENRTISLSMKKSLNKMTLNVRPDSEKPNAMLEPRLYDMINGRDHSSSFLQYRSKPNVSLVAEGQKISGHNVSIPITPESVRNPNDELHQSPTVKYDHGNDQMYVVQSENNWRAINLGNRENKDTKKITSMAIIVKPPRENVIGVDAMKNQSNSRGDTKTIVFKTSSMFRPIKNLPSKTVKRVGHENNQFIQSDMNKADGSVVKICGTERSSDVTLIRPFAEENVINSMHSDAGVMNTRKSDDDGDRNSEIHGVLTSSDNYEDAFHYDSKKNVVNNTAITRQSYPLRNSHGTVNLIRRGRKDSTTAVKSSINLDCSIPRDKNINSNTILMHSAALSNSLNTLDDSSNDDMSSKLSIVGKALSMIDDHELRTKALQALSDCGIGIERFVPVRPALNHMSIRESQTQTSVFGILDSNDFVHVTGDTESLNRLQEIERHLIVDDTYIPCKPNREVQTIVQKLNKILEERWVDKVNVEQVKQILKMNPLVEKACSLMEIDFKNVKKYDRNGLLSIHRAIISNQMRAVKIQIMVLRSCNESIDVPTLTGETGLELGIKNSVSPEIINLLLKSGASPIAQVPAQNSALTIAAIESPHFLPQLIKYVSKSGDLNNVDSEGFTALHHCVRNENIDGILALIRANADLNVRDLKSGRTPLFHAVENDLHSIARELLANGAKANIPNFSGQTVFTLFDEEKHFSLKHALNKSSK